MEIKDLKVLNDNFGVSLRTLFVNYQWEYESIYENSEIKEMFLDFLLNAIKENYIKLIRLGELLEGEPEEYIEQFRILWPDEYDPEIPEKDINNLWWWTVAPAGIIWVYPDGTLEWT